MYLTVTEHLNGSSGMLNLHIHEVWFIHFFSRKRIIEVHTESRVYFMPGTIAYWRNALNHLYGFPFEMADRNIIVNVSNISSIDPVRSVAFFNPDITSKSKYCTISQGNRKRVMDHLTRLNASIAAF